MVASKNSLSRKYFSLMTLYVNSDSFVRPRISNKARGTFDFGPKAFGVILGYWIQIDKNSPLVWGPLSMKQPQLEIFTMPLSLECHIS